MITAQERRWALAFALGLMALTTIPYLLGYFRQGEEWRFTGFVFGVEDGNSYIAKMLSGASRAFLFRTPYTAFPQRGFVAFLPYLLLGKLSAPPAQHEQLVALFHLMRWLGGIGVVFASYELIAVFIPTIRWRRWGTALVSAGGGLGWLAALGLGGLFQNGLPLEFYSPETFGFLSIYGLPHLALARALLLWGLVCYLKGGGTSTRRQAVWGGLLWFLLGLLQPLTVVVGWAALAAHLAGTALLAMLRGEAGRQEHRHSLLTGFRKALWMAALSSPMVLYTFAAFTLDPFLKNWADQNIVLSPPPLDYLLAYGLLLPLALWGAGKFLQERSWQGYLPVFWLAALPALIYAPYNLQRRLAEGAWVALIILGLKAVEGQKAHIQRFAQGLLALGFLPTIFLMAGGIGAAWQPRLPLYQPAEAVAAYEYLAAHAGKWEVVLASYGTSNALPAWAPVRVIIGHGPESVNLGALEPQVQRFYDKQTSDDERMALLKAFHIGYVFWGAEERSLGGWNPASAGYLRPWYQGGETMVFAVREESLR